MTWYFQNLSGLLDPGLPADYNSAPDGSGSVPGSFAPGDILVALGFDLGSVQGYTDPGVAVTLQANQLDGAVGVGTCPANFSIQFQAGGAGMLGGSGQPMTIEGPVDFQANATNSTACQINGAVTIESGVAVTMGGSSDIENNVTILGTGSLILSANGAVVSGNVTMGTGGTFGGLVNNGSLIINGTSIPFPFQADGAIITTFTVANPGIPPADEVLTGGGGDVVLPSEDVVQSGYAFGPSSSLIGSLPAGGGASRSRQQDDSMQQILQNSAAFPLLFLLIQSSDHISPLTGASPTVVISQNGGAFAAPAGVVSEVGNGWYQVSGNASDTTALGILVLHATAGSADPADRTYEVVAYNPQSATSLGLSNLATAVSTPPTAAAIAAAVLTDTSDTGTAGSLGHLVGNAPGWYTAPPSAGDIQSGLATSTAVAALPQMTGSGPSWYSSAGGPVTLAASQPNYAPAKASDILATPGQPIATNPSGQVTTSNPTIIRNVTVTN